MNPNSYTYGGITVQFNETQRALLEADQNLITKLLADIVEWNRQISIHTIAYNNAVAQINSYCPTLSGYANNLTNAQKLTCKTSGSDTGTCLTNQKACYNQYTNQRDVAESDRISIENQRSLTEADLVRAKQKLNDDLIVIQNAIKLQIQSQLANVSANTQGASNQVALNQSTPEAIAANIARQAAADKLRQEQNVKIVGFVLLAIVVVSLGIFTIRKILS